MSYVQDLAFLGDAGFLQHLAQQLDEHVAKLSEKTESDLRALRERIEALEHAQAKPEPSQASPAVGTEEEEK